MWRKETSEEKSQISNERTNPGNPVIFQHPFKAAPSSSFPISAGDNPGGAMQAFSGIHIPCIDQAAHLSQFNFGIRV